MIRVLITGVTGFVGRHLAAYALDQGVRVYGLSLDDAPVPGVEGRQADLTLREDADDAVAAARPDLVFHLAGAVPRDGVHISPGDLITTNVLGTLRLLNAVEKSAPDSRTLVVSSAAVYGAVGPRDCPIGEETPLRPLTDYAASKAMQDLLAGQYARAHGIAVMRARTFNLTGPGERRDQVCATLARQVAEIEAGLSDPEITVRYLSTQRDFTDVRDAARAYWGILDRGRQGVAYNVCSGQARPVRHVLQHLLELAALSGVRVTEREAEVRPGDVPVSVGDPSRLNDDTGWEPSIPLQQSLSDLLDDWRQRVRSGVS